jgi:long-chain acyl-CoA synthetase
MVEHWILSRLESYGELPALIWEGEVVSYAKLHALVHKWLKDLEARGIKTGDYVAICGDYSPEACALLIALITNRNISALIPRSVPAQIEADMQATSVDSVFVFDHGYLVDFFRRSSGEKKSPLIAKLREHGTPGLVLCSSGSTGVCKASLFDFELVLHKFQRPGTAYRTLVFLLMSHMGGVNTLFYAICSGGVIVTTQRRDAESICKAIQEHKVELLPTTPTLLKMLLISEVHQRYDFSSLKMITYGAEPMPASTLRHLHRVFPNIKLKQTYGLTELGVLQTKSRDSGSLWVKLGGKGYAIKVVDSTLWIKSSSAMLGYLNAPSPFDEEGWFKTGDLVETDGEYVRILGRKSEIINMGGEKVYPAEVESVLLEVDNIMDVTVVGRPNPITGQAVVAVVFLREAERREDLLRRLRAHCKDRLAPYKIPVSIQIADQPLHNERFKKARLQ